MVQVLVLELVLELVLGHLKIERTQKFTFFVRTSAKRSFHSQLHFAKITYQRMMGLGVGSCMATNVKHLRSRLR